MAKGSVVSVPAQDKFTRRAPNLGSAKLLNQLLNRSPEQSQGGCRRIGSNLVACAIHRVESDRLTHRVPSVRWG